MPLPPPNTNAFSPIASLLGFIKTSDFADCPALKAYLERMVKIPGGTFEMGSEDYDSGTLWAGVGGERGRMGQMATPFDATTKTLVDFSPADWLRFLRLPFTAWNKTREAKPNILPIGFHLMGHEGTQRNLTITNCFDTINHGLLL